MGLRIGGPISGGSPLVDAQLVGYVNTSLSFQASATGSGGSDNAPSATYRYGVYLFYNIGYAAYATVKFFPNWALTPRNAYSPSPRFTIYEKTGSFGGATKRSLEVPPEALSLSKTLKSPRKGLLLGLAPPVSMPSHPNCPECKAGLQSPQDNVSSVDMDFILGKRADTAGDNPFQSQSPGFTQQLTCPPGDTAQVRLPDFRCKTPYTATQEALDHFAGEFPEKWFNSSDNADQSFQD